MPKNDPDWLKFERTVEKVFSIKGLTAQHDVTQDGRQQVLILHSSAEYVLPVIVECKFHDPRSAGKVGVADVDAFVAKVLRLRNAGKISAGYLVTNTGFTSPAKGALSSTPDRQFVFLRTLAELRRGLLNLQPYFERACHEYECSDIAKLYEPARVNVERGATSQDCLEALLEFVENNTTPFCILLGDYGTGKTTSSRLLFYTLAKRALESSTSRMPIYIPLKWAFQEGNIMATLHRFMDEAGLSLVPLDALLTMHASGQLVLVLDGFDEMARRTTTQSRMDSLQDIVELCIDDSKIVLSGRPGYLPEDSQFREIFGRVGLGGPADRIRRALGTGYKQDLTTYTRMTLAPFEAHQIRSYLERWVDIRRPSHNINADNIIKRIHETYNLEDLARRPILLEMIVEALASGGELGDQDVTSPAMLYESYVETWLSIEEDKGGFRRLISRDNRLEFAEVLAWLLREYNEQSIHWRPLQSMVGHYFSLEEVDDVDSFSNDIRTCSFLRRDDDGYYSFVHLSFQEYFCARFLVSPSPRLEEFLDKDQSLEVTLGELDQEWPVILDFVGDMLGCPVSPSFWSTVEELVAECAEKLAPEEGEKLLNMMLMSDGGVLAIEISELADSFRETYEQLKSVVEDLQDDEENPVALMHSLENLSKLLHVRRLKR